ncbi:MAG: hypothetical protein DRI01_04595 [Chloroflexi bacterium]|nr:MAG: hypothetical protein DRI01_04595 [Chloroflexota bacterium]
MTLNYLDRRTTNGFTEGCHTKNKVLERVSHGLRDVDAYWSKMLMGFALSRSCFYSVK